MLGRFAAMVGLLVTLLSCGTTTRQGECRDYAPWQSCPFGSTYTCEMTEDGCRVCGCEPTGMHHQVSDPALPE